MEFYQRYCFVNQILEPTRVTASSKTLIDVILSNQQDRYALSGNLHLGLSDHDLIFTVRKNKHPRQKTRLIEYRSLKILNEATFLSDLRNVSWHTSFVYDNADDVWDHWSKLYKEVFDKHAPLKEKQIRSELLPIHGILREISYRNRLYKKHRRNPTPSSWETYRVQRNKVTACHKTEGNEIVLSRCLNYSKTRWILEKNETIATKDTVQQEQGICSYRERKSNYRSKRNRWNFQLRYGEPQWWR